VFNAVATDKNESAAGINSGRIQHLQARLAVLATTHERRGRSVAQNPENADQQEKSDANSADCKEEAAAIGSGDFVQHVEILRIYPR
jgi:hypothetical protein